MYGVDHVGTGKSVSFVRFALILKTMKRTRLWLCAPAKETSGPFTCFASKSGSKPSTRIKGFITITTALILPSSGARSANIHYQVLSKPNQTLSSSCHGQNPKSPILCSTYYTIIPRIPTQFDIKYFLQGNINLIIRSFLKNFLMTTPISTRTTNFMWKMKIVYSDINSRLTMTLKLRKWSKLWLAKSILSSKISCYRKISSTSGNPVCSQSWGKTFSTDFLRWNREKKWIQPLF